MSLSYTTGNPSNLTAGATASMTDISGPFADILTWAGAKFSASDLTTATLQTLGMNSGAQVGSGKSIIATQESRGNVAFGTLTTPDQVAGIVLPTDGLIFVCFQALWAETTAATASAALFLGANETVFSSATTGAPTTTFSRAALGTGGGLFAPIGSSGRGLGSLNPTGTSTDVTTGQFVGAGANFGISTIFAAAGTYTVSVQVKSTDASSVFMKNRKLWVWTRAF